MGGSVDWPVASIRTHHSFAVSLARISGGEPCSTRPRLKRHSCLRMFSAETLCQAQKLSALKVHPFALYLRAYEGMPSPSRARERVRVRERDFLVQQAVEIHRENLLLAEDAIELRAINRLDLLQVLGHSHQLFPMRQQRAPGEIVGLLDQR